MAVVDATAFTLAELKSRSDPNGQVATIVELLERQDEMLDDIPWMTANQVSSHKTTVRAGLPSVSYRRFNQGIASTRSATAQVEFPMCQAAALTELDFDLANLGGNPRAVRLSEAKPHMSAMAQSVADTLIYGDPVANPTTDDDKIPGLHFYFKDNTTANTKDHIISAGSNSGDDSSIWIIAWGEDTVCGIVPPGLPLGFQHNDKGEHWAFDSSSRRFWAYIDEYKWNFGLALKDWRAVVRIANIDISDLIANAANQQAIINYLIEGLEKIPSQYRSRAKIYMNSTLRTSLRLGIRADVKSGGGLTYENVGGEQVVRFDGHPVRVSNALTVTEAVVS